MSDDNANSTIELNRRRILAGLGTIGIASAGAGAGTMALFSDTEESMGNTIQAGTLDLTGGVASQSFRLGTGTTGLKPGDQGLVKMTLINSGTIDGSLDIGISNVSVSRARTSEASDEGVSQGEFEITVGTTGSEWDYPTEGEDAGTTYDAGDLIPLADAGLESPQVTTATRSNTNNNPEVSVDTAADISSSGSAEVVFDTDNDGFGELRVGYQSGSPGNGPWYYKRATQSNGFWISKQGGTPSEVLNADYDGDVMTITLDESDSNVSTSAIAIGGQCTYNDSNIPVDTDGNQLYTPIVPYKAEGDTFGQAAFNADGGELIPINGSLRNIDDVLLTSFVVDPDFGGDTDIRDDDETLVSNGYTLGSHERVRLAEGRPSRIGGLQYETNASLNSGATKYLVMEYQVPYDSSNAIQGEEVTFTIEAELNQKDSQ